MNTTELKPDNYYWVEIDGYHNKHVPLYYNAMGQWRVYVLDSTRFITTYTLNLLFGKKCIKRLVDFDNDLTDTPKESYGPTPEPYRRLADTPEGESADFHVLFGNTSMTLIEGMYVPCGEEPENLLIYKEKN